GLDGWERNVHDGLVENDHQHARTEHDERQPSRFLMRSNRHRDLLNKKRVGEASGSADVREPDSYARTSVTQANSLTQTSAPARTFLNAPSPGSHPAWDWRLGAAAASISAIRSLSIAFM